MSRWVSSDIKNVNVEGSAKLLTRFRNLPFLLQISIEISITICKFQLPRFQNFNRLAPAVPRAHYHVKTHSLYIAFSIRKYPLKSVFLLSEILDFKILPKHKKDFSDGRQDFKLVG